MKKNLRFITISFAIIINCGSYHVADAQYVTIPDANFVSWLNTHGFASCMNGNQMDTTCSLIQNANTIDIDNSPISDLTGLQYFPNLQMLNLQNMNQLNFIPPLPPLQQLIIAYCGITTLPPLPNSLTFLGCTGNNLYSLPPLPPNLQTLDCDGNHLTSLPALPTYLSYLNCSGNNITNLPALTPYMTTLKCAGNYLTSLPILSSPNYVWIDCSNNQITSLPTLSGITNPGVTYFNFSINHLTSIPTLPTYLSILYCTQNLLTTLPDLPPNLNSLICYNNNITSLPELPASLQDLNISNNPNLFCLPVLKQMNNLSFINTGITCLPNYGIVANSNPPLSSLPLCEVINTNNCPMYWNISGKIYSDTNSNCVADTLETKLSNIKLNLYSGGNLQQQTFTGGEGLYSFDTDTGTFTYAVDTTNLPIMVSCPAAGFQSSVISIANWTDDNMNFGITCKPGFDIGANAVVRESGSFRPGHLATVNFKAGDLSNKYGLHCANGIGGVVTIVMNGSLSYYAPANGALTPVVNGDTLTYTISDFGTSNFNSDFKVIVQIDTTAVLGSSACFDITVNPVNGDNNPSNNNLQHCFTVVNSVDPNEKEVYPYGNISLPDNKLTYTIHYQNTGNAPAENIYILDTLDVNLDASTFELLAYNYEPLIQIKENTVRFSFKDINLPDSLSNEPASHGFIQYSVKLRDSIPLPTEIKNSAFIYFDFNLPIQTNVVSDTVRIDCNKVGTIILSKQSYCNGDTVYASSTLSNHWSKQWYVDSILISNYNSITLANLADGSHQLKLVAVYDSCTQIIFSNFAINNLPLINLGNDITSCPNIIDAGTGSASYLWSNGQTTQKIIATLSGNYSVMITDFNGCKNSDTINVNINSIPTIELDNDTSGCAPLMLDAGIGYPSYFWSNGTTMQTLSVTASGNYSVIVTDSIGCANADTVIVSLFPAPTINLGSDTVTCASSVVLNAGLGYSSYLWNNGSSVQITLVNASGNYWVAVTNNYGCPATDTVQVIVNAIPAISLGFDTATCNMPVLLDAGTGYFSYQWSTGATTQFISAQLTSAYTVTVTNNYGCTKSDNINVTVNPPPLVFLGYDTTTCNIPVVLNAGVNNATYLWSNGKSTKKITVHNSGSFWVVVTDINGCTNSDSISVTINPLPVVTFNAFANSDTLCINSGVQTISDGNPSGGSFSGTGVSGNQFDPNVAGTGLHYIIYQFTDSNGCSNSATDSVWVDLCLGINSISKDETFIVYPSPITSNILHIGYILLQNKAGKFQIINTTGQVVYQYNLPQWSNKQDLILPNLANGIYNATIILDNKRVSKTIAIIRE